MFIQLYFRFTSLLSCWFTFAASSEFFWSVLISICKRSISWANSTSLWRVFSRDILRISSPRRLEKRIFICIAGHLIFHFLHKIDFLDIETYSKKERKLLTPKIDFFLSVGNFFFESVSKQSYKWCLQVFISYQIL